VCKAGRETGGRPEKTGSGPAAPDDCLTGAEQGSESSPSQEWSQDRLAAYTCRRRTASNVSCVRGVGWGSGPGGPGNGPAFTPTVTSVVTTATVASTSTVTSVDAQSRPSM
jgi:hypothetical protein